MAALVAGLALYLQLAFAGPGALAITAPPGDPVASLAEHALCLAVQAEYGRRDGNRAPTVPVHDHTLFCCLWHPLPGIAAQVAQVAFPIAYATVALVGRDETVPVSGPHYGPANARAPPALA